MTPREELARLVDDITAMKGDPEMADSEEQALRAMHALLDEHLHRGDRPIEVNVSMSDLPAVQEALAYCADSITRRGDALHQAWALIANAYVDASPGPETGWDAAPAEWRQAAERWRDEQFLPLLAESHPLLAQSCCVCDEDTTTDHVCSDCAAQLDNIGGEHEEALQRHPELIDRIRAAKADRSHAIESESRRPR